MLNIKNCAIGCIILLLPLFLNSEEARYPEASAVQDCAHWFCIKDGIDPIKLPAMPDERIGDEETGSPDIIRDFHPILH